MLSYIGSDKPQVIRLKRPKLRPSIPNLRQLIRAAASFSALIERQTDTGPKTTGDSGVFRLTFAFLKAKGCDIVPAESELSLSSLRE